jgi:Gcd10p family
MRIDTLSQMMNLGNVRPGGRYIAVDEASGMVVSALLERLGGLFSIHALLTSVPRKIYLRYWAINRNLRRGFATCISCHDADELSEKVDY